MNTNFLAIIIPAEQMTVRIISLIQSLKNQSFRNFHIFVVLTTPYNKIINGVTTIVQPKTKGNPSKKRNHGLKLQKYRYLLFLDDDIVLSSNWIQKVKKNFQKRDISAIVGPLRTPPLTSFRRKISGYILESPLLSVQFSPQKVSSQLSYVRDYPSAAFAIRTADFKACGGFQTTLYPGEDTKLCLDITEKLRKKILYNPELNAYHERKRFPIEFLKQISRYATQRGKFALLYPQTSLHLVYFLPSLFTLYILMVVLFLLANMNSFILIFPPLLYLFSVCINFMYIYWKSKNIRLAFYVSIGIMATHLIYGVFFIKGLLQI